MPSDRLRPLIQAELPSLVELRHDLHRHPELSNSERRTSQVVQRELTALGIAFKTDFGASGTGIVAHIPPTSPGNASKPATALRADMDALPIHEETGRHYASASPGVMHACGHDGHTTILLGAARTLLRLDRPHPITLVFQPAEEHGAGASVLCEQGALKGQAGGGIGPPVGRIYGLHGWPQLNIGTVATRAGPLLAATDEFQVTIVGVGGHAAYPHMCRDPIVAAAAAVSALQTLVSRSIAPFESAVCTVAQINAGSATNIIPGAATFAGTVRTLTAEVRSLARQRFFQIVESTAAAHGCTASIDWREGYPVTHNDPAETERFFAIAGDALGAASVHRVDHPTMGGEDFSYYARHIPSCFFFLGLKPPSADRYPALHQPDFDFNDQAIPLGIEMMCRVATAT